MCLLHSPPFNGFRIDSKAGALAGQALVLFDPQRMLIDEVVLCEDGHAQERSLLDQVLPLLAKNDLSIADRNFCTLAFLFGIKACGARFIIREHRAMPSKSLGKPRYVGLCETGRVYEEPIELHDPRTDGTSQVRRITIRLKTVTRDGDQETHVLTNLPSKVSAVRVADLYRQSWTLEQAFNELTDTLALRAQHAGLSQGGVIRVLSGQQLRRTAALKGVLRGVHGEEKVEREVSNSYLSNEIQSVYGGMMVALPPTKWNKFQKMTTAQLADQLLQWGGDTDLSRYPKHPRGPEKPKGKLPNARAKHVARTTTFVQKTAEATNDCFNPKPL